MPPAYELLLLNTSIPQIQAAQSGDTYLCPRELAVVVNSATDAVRITQTGAGNAILIEDSANPDSTPFVVTAAGDVGIGTSSPSARLTLQESAASPTALNMLNRNSTQRWALAVDAAAVDDKILAFIDQTNSAVRMALDTSGNLGLGVPPSLWGATAKAMQLSYASIRGRTDVPSSFSVTANSFWNGTNDIYIESGQKPTKYETFDGGHAWYTAGTGTAGNAISFTQAMTLDASGNLGVGTTSPSPYTAGSRVVHIDGGANAAELKLTNNTSGASGVTGALIQMTGNDLYIWNAENSFLSLGANNTERARITSGGNLLVQTDNSSTTAGVGVKINASATAPVVSVVGSASTSADPTYLLYSTGAAAYRFYVDFAGTINATNTTIAGISDQRLKENIRDLDVGLDAILALKPRKFDWKAGKGKDKKDDRGFIAQEFEQVFPDLVDKWLDPAPEGEEPYKSVRPDLIPVLVKAIQEQQAMINELKAKVASLGA